MEEWVGMPCRKPWVLLVLASLLAGCKQDVGEEAGGATPGTVIFRSSDGRVLTQEELKHMNGSVHYEIIGAEAVTEQARELHERGREAGAKGEYGKAIELLRAAAEAAPRWPYPVYDMAYTYLLMKDFEHARACYGKTVELSPRVFFTAITAVDTLEREKKGELPEGLYLAYLSLEWMDKDEGRASFVKQLAERQPTFAPGLKERALLAEKDDEKLEWIEKGLAAKPDGETKGILLINKALLLNKQGKKDEAVKLLGELAVDPGSTFGTEHLAKTVLANVVGEGWK